MVEHSDEKILEMVGLAKLASVKMGLKKVLKEVDDLKKIYKNDPIKRGKILELDLHVIHAISSVDNINETNEN